MTTPYRPDNPFASAARTYHPDNPFAPRAPEPRRGVVSNLARGAATGLAKAGTGLVGGIGGLIGSDRLKDWATTTEEQVQSFYDPEGTAGTVGEIGGRVLGEGATAIAGGAAALKGLTRVAPRAATALRGLQAARSTGGVGGAVAAGAKRVAGTVGPILPVSAAIGAGYRPDNPFRGAAEGVALDLAGAAVFDAVGGGVRAVKGAKEARRSAQTVDDLTRIDDALHRPEVRRVPRGDVADEVAIRRADTSFDFGDATGARPPDLPPLDPRVASRYAKRDTPDLLDYFEELAERHGRESVPAVNERTAWTAETTWNTAQKLSGQPITQRGGRAIGAAQAASRVADNVEAVLRHRGVSADYLASRWAEAQSRGFQSAGAGTTWVADPTAQARSLVGNERGAVRNPFEAYRAAEQGRRVRGASASPVAADPNVQAVLAAGQPPTPSGTLGVKGAAGRVYQKMLDDVYAIRRFGREVGGSEELSHLASTARGHGGLARQLVGDRPGAVLPGGAPTVRDALTAAKGIEGDVIALTRAERALELLDNGMGWKASFTPDQARATVALYQGNTAVQEAAEKLRGVYRHMLDLRYRAGMLSDEAYQSIVAKGESYIPFVRDFGEETAALAEAGGRNFNKRSGVRRMEEGAAEAAIVNPFEQAIVDAQQTAKAVLRQRVMQGVNAIVDADPAAAAGWIRKLGTAPQQVSRSAREQGRVVEAVVNGQRTYFEVVDDDLYEALGSLGPQSQNIAMRVMAPFKRLLQTGVTMWPEFTVSNATRDAFFTNVAYALPAKQALAGATVGAGVGAATDSESRLRGAVRGAAIGGGAGIMSQHAARLAGAMRSILNNDDVFQAWMREGGSGGGMYVRDLKDASTVIKQLRRDGVSPADIVNPKRWWDGLTMVNEFIENAPRLARYKSLMAEGTSPLAAAAGARDVSVDFANRGADGFVRAAAQTTAFWNPKLQGMDKLVRMFKNPRTWALGAMSMTAPSVALWSINKDDPDYLDRPLYERNLFWLVPVGQQENGKTRFLRIPKPFEPGFVFASIPERLLEFAYARDPEATTHALADIMGSVAEGLAPIPNALQPVLEASIGKGGFDFFRQREIVDRGLQQLPAAERTSAWTSNAGRGAAAAINALPGVPDVAPAKVDHLLQSWTGSLGRFASENIVDPLAQRAGLDTRPVRPAQSVAQRTRFLANDPGLNAEPIRQLYRRYDKAEERYRALSRMVRSDDPGAEAYLAKHEDALATYLALEPVIKQLDEVRSVRREIENDRTMTAQDKRRQIGELMALAQEIVAQGRAPATMAHRR